MPPGRRRTVLPVWTVARAVPPSMPRVLAGVELVLVRHRVRVHLAHGPVHATGPGRVVVLVVPPAGAVGSLRRRAARPGRIRSDRRVLVVRDRGGRGLPVGGVLRGHQAPGGLDALERPLSLAADPHVTGQAGRSARTGMRLAVDGLLDLTLARFLTALPGRGRAVAAGALGHRLLTRSRRRRKAGPEPSRRSPPAAAR